MKEGEGPMDQESGVELLIQTGDLPYMPPLPESFSQSDYVESEALTGLMADVVVQQFVHRPDIVAAWDEDDIQVRWKRKGTPKAMGKCSLSSPVARHYGAPTFFIWVGAADLRQMAATRGQLVALLHHELLHVGFDFATGAPLIMPHDAEVFVEELSVHGVWRPDYRALVATCQSLPKVA